MMSKPPGLSPQTTGRSYPKAEKVSQRAAGAVIVTAINSQRVFVVGECFARAQFPMLPGMTVLQALSAPRFTTFADVKKNPTWADAQRQQMNPV